MKRHRRTVANAVPFGRVTILAQVLAAAIVVGYLFSSTGVQIPFLTSSSYQLEAYAADADGLNPVNRPEVMIAGVQEGSVQSVTYSPRRREALIRLTLDGSARGKLFANATLRIFPRSPLNNLVVDISPGTPAAGPLRGSVIPNVAPAPVGFDQVLADMNAPDRTYAQIMIGTLGTMLRNRPGPLRDAILRVPTMIKNATTLSAELAARRRDLTELVGQLDQIVTATGQRGGQLTQALALARQTLTVTAARQRAIERALTALPGTLTQATAAFASVQQLARPLNPALVGLRSVTSRLPAAVADVRSLLPSLQSTLGELGNLTRQGTAPLQSLGRTLSVLSPTARSLNSSELLPTLARAVTTISQNKSKISEIERFWPSTFSTQNSISPLTRAVFLDAVPVNPKMFGLTSWSTFTPAMSSATAAARALRRAHPDLFNVPANLRAEPLPLLAAIALIDQRCQAHQLAACIVLQTVYAHPLQLLGSP